MSRRCATSVALCLAVVACESTPAPRAQRPSARPQAVPPAQEPPRAPSPEAPPESREQEAASLVFPGADRSHDDLLAHLSRDPMQSFKAVGSTSTVFRTELRGPITGAFKAQTLERPLGAASEVAAYRLSRCLGMSNVPPAITRTVRASELQQRLVEEQRPAWPEISQRLVVGDDGVVAGAMIYWIPDLSEVGLDGRRGAARLGEWLSRRGVLPPPRRELAASASTMIAFDYLIGNFDRWSGGNARGSSDGKRVYPRDHDHAFPPAMREELHRRLWERLTKVERFSTSFYEAVVGLSRGCFELELAADPAGAAGQLLRQAQIDGVFDRQQALLSHVDALIQLNGRRRVLVFP